jgi:hypothetical protein
MEARPAFVGKFCFDSSGRYLAWSNRDGTVDVADLKLVISDPAMK